MIAQRRCRFPFGSTKNCACCWRRARGAHLITSESFSVERCAFTCARSSNEKQQPKLVGLQTSILGRVVPWPVLTGVWTNAGNASKRRLPLHRAGRLGMIEETVGHLDPAVSRRSRASAVILGSNHLPVCAPLRRGRGETTRKVRENLLTHGYRRTARGRRFQVRPAQPPILIGQPRSLGRD